jgi:predicted CXXCH cytochrome family protein
MKSFCKESGFILGLLLSTSVLASCSLSGLISRQYDVVDANKYDNPHTSCTDCHETPNPKGEKALFPPETDPSKICLNCHNYRVNHHPTDFVPAAPLKAVFPLYNGKVTCLTCHDNHGGFQHKGTPKLLRGGPYANPRKICFDCHTDEQYAHINPHLMQDNEGNRLLVDGAPVCLKCHELSPDPTKDKANSVLFRADIGFLCWRCHPLMHDRDFLAKHYLVVPSDEMLMNMNRPDVREKFTLPLVPRGRITCSTCHNPHQKGIITYEPAASGADSLYRLRSGNICDACHKY